MLVRTPDNLDSPNWTTEGWSVEWTQFIPVMLRDVWASLGREAKVAAYVVAEEARDRASLLVD